MTVLTLSLCSEEKSIHPIFGITVVEDSQ